jgi:hypothetical protein
MCSIVIWPAPFSLSTSLRSGQKARHPCTAFAVLAALDVAPSGSFHVARCTVRLLNWIADGVWISNEGSGESVGRCDRLLRLPVLAIAASRI